MEIGTRFEESLTPEGRARILIDAISDYAVYMLDPRGLITSWNTGAQRFKGYRESEVLGTSFSRFYTEEDKEAGMPTRALEAAARDGRFESEGWRVRKDGRRFWAHVVIDPIRTPSGSLVGFAKITRDLTERKEAQAALERTREALFQSQKMDAIGQLTGGIAHDFNNLLMAILSSLQLMRKRVGADARMILLLDNASQAAQRGTTLTQRMLAFARRQELDPKQIDIPTLVRGMTDLLQRSLGPLITIDTRAPFTLGRVCVDANQLEMALLNLAVNSRDAMPQGGTLTIAAQMEEVASGHLTQLPVGQYVCLSVSDTGEGMDDTTLARATEPFFTTKGVGRGTGLGLSMIHGLAEQTGGKLILKSKKGEGTTAEIWLPAVKADEMIPDGPMVSGAIEKSVAPLTVLAVDDDSLVLMNTGLMLEDLGHRVLTATSGKQALEILWQEPNVELVIVDQAMPNMTGTELIKEIKKHWPHMPIILATGYAELPPGAAQETKLAKPFGEDELAKAVAKAVHRKM